MPVETFAYIDSLKASNPPGSDGLVQGDDHIRGIKTALKNSFTGITGATNVTQTTLDALQANTHEFFVPVGAVMDFLDRVPTGWLELNGGVGNRTTHARLFALYGTTYGAGDGSTTFTLPDMRDRYRRQRSGTYAANATIAAQVGTHGHTASATTTLSIASDGSHSHGGVTAGASANHTHDFTTASAGAHSHGGATLGADRTLDHTHNLPSAGSFIAGWIGGGSFTGSNVATSAGTTSSGTNSGNLDHLHGISSDGAHTHTGTTGGFSVDHAHGITPDGGHGHVGSSAATAVTVANSTTQENLPNTFVVITCVKY